MRVMRTTIRRPAAGGVFLPLALGLVAGVCALAQTSSPPYYFTTLAGTSSAGSVDGTAGAARFNFPQGLTIDPAGNLYVADWGNCTVRKITPAGVVSTVAGRAGDVRDLNGPASSARFRSVSGVAADRLGNLYVATSTSIRRIGTDGMMSTLAGYTGDGYPAPSSSDGTGADAHFNGINGLAVDAAGTVYASDAGGSTIRRITPAGVVTTLAGSGSVGDADGTGTAAGFFGPDGLAVDSGGSLYVADSGNSTIRKILVGGVVTTLAGRARVTGSVDGVGAVAAFNSPHGLAVNQAGTVYVSDYLNQSIRVVTQAGQVTTLAGRPPASGNSDQGGTAGSTDGVGAAATFNGPNGLALDAVGNLYVADSTNNMIRKVTPAGVVTTVAGLSPDQATGSVDGVGSAARFSAPQGVAVAPDGTCYVADSGNHVIRRISADGTVSTLAGVAGQSGYADGVGSAARFNGPGGLAVDAAGNVYVIEAGNSTVRKITPSGTVTTLAGTGGILGQSIDGLGTPNESSRTTAIAVAPGGEIYVGEMGLVFYPQYYYYEYFQRIRKVTATGVVSTVWTGHDSHAVLAGVAVAPDGTVYYCDSTYQSVYRIGSDGNPVRQFFSGFAPAGLTIDPSGRIFLIDGRNFDSSRVARLWPDGTLEMVGGQTYQQGNVTGLGTAARFGGLAGIAADAAGNLFVTCKDNSIRKGVIAAAPVIVTQPQGRTVATGESVQFAVTVAAVPDPVYQWYFNGAAITGATAASYGFAGARAADAGEYSVVVANELGTVTSAKAALAISAAPPSPSSSGGSTGGGGGGAPSVWFLGGLALLFGARRWLADRRRPAHEG